MRNRIALVFMLVLGLIAMASARATIFDGREIMSQVVDRPDGDDRKMVMRLILINEKEQTRERTVLSFSKDYGGDTKRILYFEKPADVKGVTLLTWEYDDPSKEDDRWLYLPALRKTRRLSGSAKNEYFLGTDFTYDDLGEHSVEEDNHELVKEEMFNGQICWVVNSVPRGTDGIYGKKVCWVRKDCLVIVKTEYYDQNQRLLKVLNALDIELRDGFWTILKMEMNNVQSKHKTVVEITDIKYNIDLKDSFFSVATLERGIL